MFLWVSIRLAILAAACSSMLIASPAVLAASNGSPTPRQIRDAARRMQRSPDVWATVNICNTRRHRHMIGIRGQLPAPGFRAGLYMTIQVEYWIKAKRKFMPDSHAKQSLSLGTHSRGRHQAGFTWRFSPPAILSATIVFEWKLGHRVIGRTTRAAAGGIKHVDDGDPKGYSAATCRILR